MLRLIGFYVLVFATLLVARSLLGWVPIVGHLLRIPLLSFFIVAALLSLAGSRWASASLDRARQRAAERRFGAVDTPHNRGKLGTLILRQGRAARALPHLEAAAAGEAEVAEWAYQLGLAQVELGNFEEGLSALQRALHLDEQVGFGKPWLCAAYASLKLDDPTSALVKLQHFERNHGASPESAFRRAQVHKRLGQKEQAQEALADVPLLAAQLAKYQRSSSAQWILRARWMRLFG